MSKPAAGPSTISRSIVDEVDGYTSSVRGIEIEAVRTGRSFGPNNVLTARTDEFVMTSVATGFPMLGRTTLGDDLIVAVTIANAPNGARWCGIDIEPGTVLIYGPGAEHTAINPAGLRFTFAATGIGVVAELAGQLGRDFTPPPPVRSMFSSPRRQVEHSTQPSHRSLRPRPTVLHVSTVRTMS